MENGSGEPNLNTGAQCGIWCALFIDFGLRWVFTKLGYYRTRQPATNSFEKPKTPIEKILSDSDTDTNKTKIMLLKSTKIANLTTFERVKAALKPKGNIYTTITQDLKKDNKATTLF